MSTKKCEYCGQEYNVDDNAWDPRECPVCHTNFSTGLPPEVELSAIDTIMLICSIVLVFGPILIIIWGGREDFLKCIAGIVIGIGWMVYIYNKYSEAISLRRIAKTDREKYKSIQSSNMRQKIKNQKVEAAEAEKEYQARAAYTPACPICGMKYSVYRVSALDRSVSTAVWGIASDAIGKQWECRNCHHMFNADAVVQQPATPSSQPAEPAPTPTPASDPTEEIRKYKKLLDDGIITQEEFDQKKRQLLGL